MKLRQLLLTVSFVGGIALASVSANASDMSADFVHKASIANEFEIEASKIALDKSENSDVKEVAQQMIDDHTKTGEKLTTALAASNTDIKPAEELDSKHKGMLDKLQAVSADGFDARYISMQKDAHKEAIKLFTGYSTKGNNPALKEFAAKTLPTLKMHLKHVQELAANN